MIKKVLRNDLKKLLSYLLVVCLITVCSSVQSAKLTKAIDSHQMDNVSIMKELKQERTLNSTTYLLPNGYKRTDLYFENIRYKSDNQMVAYDNELVGISGADVFLLESKNEEINKYKYVNKSSDNKVFFPNKLNDGIILCHDKYTIKMIPGQKEEIDDRSNREDVDESKEHYYISKSNNLNVINYLSESKNISY